MALPAGMQFGGYQILGLLGSGGMGEVYRAHDPRLNRIVAVKVIAGDFAHSPSFRERFRREARILAALSHPNIATVYSVEEDERMLALSMELVEGQNLTELMRTGGMAIDRVLKIGVQIADAIAAAHERGVTHRDLKPSNVIVAPDGRVKVLDFGLAKLAQSSSSEIETSPPVSELTKEGHIVGTPLYMSPEQAEGRTVDYRSDIFSFGIILYEMVTGETPFKGTSVLSILTSIVRDTPLPPFEINPRVPRDLSRIIRRCLAKDPEDRYQSTKDLRNDLSDLRQEITSGEIVPLAPTRVRHRVGRYAAFAVAGLALAVAAWIVARQSAAPSAAFLPVSVSQLTFDPGVEMSPSLSPDGKWIAYARRDGSRSDVYLQAVGGENAINLTRDLEGGGEQPAFSPDGDRIAFRSQAYGGGLFVMGRTGELVRRVSDQGFNPSWSPDAKSLTYSTTSAGDFPSAHPGGSELWTVNIETGEKRRLLGSDAVQPAWSPDDRWIAFWAVDPNTHQRDLWTLSAQGGRPNRVTNDPANDGSPSWSPDGRYLYFSSDRGGTLNLWRVSIGRSSGTAVGDPDAVTTPNPNAVHPSLSSDGRRLVYASYTWTASVFSVPFDPQGLEVKGNPTWIIGGPYLWSGARVSPDGKNLAMVRWGQQQDLFIVGTDGSGLRRLTNDRLGIRCPEWSPDSKRIVFSRTLQADGSLIVVDIATGNVTRLSTGLVDGSLGCAGWSPDGQQIVVAQGPPNPAAFILNVRSTEGKGAIQKLPPSPKAPFIPRSWSPDGQRLAGTIGTHVATYSLVARNYELLTDSDTATPASPTYWLPGSRHVLFMAPRPTDLMIVDTVQRKTKRVLSVSPQILRGASITHDGDQLFYSHGPEEGDIWLAMMPEEKR